MIVSTFMEWIIYLPMKPSKSPVLWLIFLVNQQKILFMLQVPMSVSRNLRSSFLRSFHIASILTKGNTQRFKVRSGLGVNPGNSAGASRREWVAQLRASAMRERWEAEEESIAKRKFFRPPPGLNVFFSPTFETPSWPLASAVAMLRESAAPEMYCCEDNPLYAKVSVKQWS